MKKWLCVLTILICFTSPVCALDIDIDGVDIIDFGLYTATPSKMAAADTTALGWINILSSDDIKLIEQTDKVPALAGSKFGITYRINGKPLGKNVVLTIKMLSPGLVNEMTGKRSSSDVWSSRKTIGSVTYDGYAFERPWEAVPGAWTIQVFYKDRKLAEKIFLVYVPDGKPLESASERTRDDSEERNAYEKAVQDDTALSYQVFMLNYPDSIFKHNAGERLMSLTLYRKAAAAHTVRALQRYLSLLPAGYHADKAWSDIEGLEFEFYERADAAWGYRDFLKKYPGSAFKDRALQRAEELIYGIVKFKDRIHDYDEFLAVFPSGRFAGEAGQRLAALKEKEKEFNDVSGLDSIPALEEYVTTNPSGPFTPDAEKKRAQMIISGTDPEAGLPLKSPFHLKKGTLPFSTLYFRNPLDGPVTIVLSGEEGVIETFKPGESGRMEFISGIYDSAVIMDNKDRLVLTGKLAFSGEYLFHIDHEISDLRIVEITSEVVNYSRAGIVYPEKDISNYAQYTEMLKARRKDFVKANFPLKRSVPFTTLVAYSSSDRENMRKLAHKGFERIYMQDAEQTLTMPDGWKEFWEKAVLEMPDDKKLRDLSPEYARYFGGRAIWPLFAFIKRMNEPSRERRSYRGDTLAPLRDRVIEALAEINRGAADEITAALPYADRQTGHSLLKALSYIPEPSHEDLFLDLLEDRDDTFKHTAVNGLYKIATEKSLKPLIDVIYGVDYRFARETALSALEHISYRDQPEIRIDKEDFIKVLKAYDDWIGLHYKTFRRQRANIFISNMPKRVIEDDVFNMIVTETGEARRLLCEALSNNPSEKHFKLLEQCWKDPDRETRKAAVKGFAGIDGRGIGMVMEILKDPDDREIRRIAIQSLALNGSEKAYDALKTLTEGNEGREALKAIAESGSPAAAEYLVNRMLKTRKSGPFNTTEIVMMGKTAVPPLRKALDHPDEKKRLAVIDTLSKIRDNDALEALYAALKDDAARNRIVAVKAIYTHETMYMRKEVPDVLISALRDEEINSYEIMDLIIKKHITEAAEAVEGVFIRDMNRGEINYRAIHALALSDRRDKLSIAVPVLLEKIHDRTKPVNYMNYTALGQTGDDRAVEYLIKTADEGGVVEQAVHALGWSKTGKAAAYLSGLLGRILHDRNGYFSSINYRHKPVRLIRAVIRALGDIQDDSAVPVLEETIKAIAQEPGQTRLHSEVIIAIGKITGPESDMALIRELARLRKHERKDIGGLYLALKQINDLKENVIDILTPVLHDGSPDSVKEAVYILGKIGTPKAMDIITGLQGKSGDLDRVIFSQLRSNGALKIDHIVKQYSGTVHTIEMVRQLGESGSIRALRHILELFDERPEDKNRGLKNAASGAIRNILENTYPGLYIPELSPTDVKMMIERREVVL